MNKYSPNAMEKVIKTSPGSTLWEIFALRGRNSQTDYIDVGVCSHQTAPEINCSDRQ
jgi:hypothetical protein